MSDARWAELAQACVGGSVTEGTMFGSRGLRTGRKFFALWWHGSLVTKLPPARRQALVDAGDAEQFEPMAGRPMNGWVVVSPQAVWLPLAEEARAFVEAQATRP
jgi:hypothetical protein